MKISPVSWMLRLTFLLAVDNTYQLGGSDDEREREQNAVLIEELERKKRLRRLAVPTDDRRVRERLRAYGEPITLFGEGVSDEEVFNRTGVSLTLGD